MAYKSTVDGADVMLDLAKLLGFKHVAQCIGDVDSLASALGAACNKVGAETGVRPTIQLAKSLGAAYNKVGEVPPAPGHDSIAKPLGDRLVGAD